MDHGIDDPKALQMSSSHHRRKQPAAKVRILVLIGGQPATMESLQQDEDATNAECLPFSIDVYLCSTS